MNFHWTDAIDQSVRVLAAPFGFGPRTGAETLARQLGLTLSNWRDSTSLPAHGRCSTVVNFGVVQPGSHGDGDVRVWIDPLMWLRASLPSEITGYDLLLAEAFFPTRASSSFGGNRAVDVQPLYDVSPMQPRQGSAGRVLISCGGMVTPYGSSAHMCHAPAAFIQAIARAAQCRRGSEVICCLPVTLTADIAREVAMPDVKYVSPSRATFLELLDSADVYFVNPGLYGPFEAFESGRWVALTPPISYTQVGQALEFHKRGVAGDVPLLGEVIASVGPQEFTFGAEQENCFRRIAEWWEQVSAKPSTHEELKQWAGITMVERNANLTNARRELAEATRSLPHAANVLTNLIPGISR